MGTIDGVCFPYEYIFSGLGVCSIKIHVDEKWKPISEEDTEKADILSTIMESLDDIHDNRKIIWGKRLVRGLPTSTYLDSKGSTLEIVRDERNRVVIVYWTKATIK